MAMRRGLSRRNARHVSSNPPPPVVCRGSGVDFRHNRPKPPEVPFCEETWKECDYSQGRIPHTRRQAAQLSRATAQLGQAGSARVLVGPWHGAIHARALYDGKHQHAAFEQQAQRLR